ncbi:MAG: ABC transporter ATP-binding protein, partial [Gemmatimonadota bacterium]
TVLDVDAIEVRAGEVVAVVGPNGAGKSTLFRLLLLIESPDAGTVRLSGRAARPGDAAARAQLAGVFQRPLLFSGTVGDNIGFGLRARRVARRERRRRTEEALGWMELQHLADAPVHTLSGGEAQRVALARALVTEPTVLLLDEPTANLDAMIRRRFRGDLERVARQRAGAIVLITHDAAEAFGLADRVVVLQDGRVAQTGSPDDILLRPGSRFVAELTGAELLLHGVVEAEDDELVAVRIAGGTLLWATRTARDLGPGTDAVVAYRPEDVTLSAAGDEPRTSAVNRVTGRLDTIVPTGSLTHVRLSGDGVTLMALVTRRSMESLGLVAGSAATAHIKATALHAWHRETHP